MKTDKNTAKTPARRRLLRPVLAGAIVLALGAAGLHWQRQHALHGFLAAHIPARPNLSHFSPELSDRVSDDERAVREGKKDLEAYRELATLYHASGFYPEAIQCYRVLLQADPSETLWPHRLAGLYAGYGDLAAAIPLWERVLEKSPEYLPARIHLGDAYLKSNREADAIRTYEEVLKRDASNPYALTSLARVDIRERNYARACERLELATRQSNNAIGQDLLATVYEQLGKNDQAIALRARCKASGAYFDPPDPWNDVIYDDCYDSYRTSVAAGTAEHSGDLPTARRLMDRAISLDPGNGWLLYQAGTIANSAGDKSAAKEYLEKASRVAPGNSDVWIQLIELYASLGDQASANQALRAGLTNCPSSPALRLQYARKLAKAGQFDEAIAQCQEAFRLRPQEADPLIEIAKIYFQQERYQEAKAVLERALVSQPEHPVVLGTLAMFAIETGDEPGAREWLRRCALQVRIPREQIDMLRTEFTQRFGDPSE